MKVMGALKPSERSERHCVEFPAAFDGAPNAQFNFEFTGAPEAEVAHGPVAVSAVVTGWRGGENVKAVWVMVSIEGGSDLLPVRIHYEFEGERGIDEHQR